MMKRPNWKLTKHKKAFTFVELLIAMVIIAIVSGAVIMLAYTYFNHFEQAKELSMARERGIMVVTYLEKRILNAGLGMPTGTTSFKNGFGETLLSAIAVEIGGEEWDKTVFKPDEDREDSEELLIAYAIPSGMRTIEYSQIGTGGETIRLSSLDASKIEKNNKSTTKGWTVVPSQRMPFYITDYNTANKTIELTPGTDGTWAVPANEELHLVRFMKAFVENETFKVNDLTIPGGSQPLVEGILDCRFVMDGESGLLSVFILARGNRKYSRPVTPESLKGWDFPLPSGARNYHLTVINKGWRVRN